MRKTEKGDNSVMGFKNFTKSSSGHLHLRHNICDPYIMILVQAVLEIFCSHASIGV